MKWTKPLFSKPNPPLYRVLGMLLAFVALLVSAPIVCLIIAFMCGNDEFDPNESVRTGKAAATQIRSWARLGRRGDDRSVKFPKSAKNEWFYEGGSFGGSIIYGVFDCRSNEDCLNAVESLSGLRPEALRTWAPSRYAVVMEGLEFYLKRGLGSRRLTSNPWNVRRIKNGLVHEWIEGDHRTMVYYAIDLDRNRVYYHYESGGFPADEYRVRSDGVKRQATAQ